MLTPPTPEMPPFAVEWRGRHAFLRGELDLATAERVGELLDPARAVETIDVSGLTFVDSAGLRALLRARRDRPALCYLDPPPALCRLAELAGVTDLLFGPPDAP